MNFGAMMLGSGASEETGLSNYWPLDASGRNLIPSSINNTDTDITYTTGKLGSACASFNGTTSKITTAVNGPTGAAPRSMSCWFKQNTLIQRGIVGYGTTAANQLFELNSNGNGYISVNIWGANPSPSNLITAGTWNHAVVTYDGTTLKVYLNNGTPASATVTLATTAIPIYIGTSAYGSFAFFNGLIDDPCMWDRALTASEVSTIYSAGVGKAYPFYP